MKVMVLNCGSSSLKYRLLDMPSERELAGGEAQRVGPTTAKRGCIFHRVAGKLREVPADMPDHASAFQQVMALLAEEPTLQPEVLGHRLVHGGQRFSRHCVITTQDIDDLEAIQDLAPLHNPPATRLIRACSQLYPSLPQVAVFDTAYHATIPECARAYAIPANLREQLGIRKYGFHGTSHQYVAQEAAKMLGCPLEELDAVSCHLGSGGASLCAIRGGQSIDNTMGYSPLQGLIMSTRCGDLDPAVTLGLLSGALGSAPQVEELLNKKSGVLGLSGRSADIRDVLAGQADSADSPRDRQTSAIYLWRIRKYLGSYLAAVGKARAVIFTDTIGETVPAVRWAVCADMGCFGLRIDPAANQAAKKLPVDVAQADSPVRILVIATNEELAIARQCHALLAGPQAGLRSAV